MTNVFRRLIQQEFGYPLYYKFFVFFKNRIEEKKISNEYVFTEMYDILKKKDVEVLRGMQRRLANTMVSSMGICKSYLFVVIIYCLANLFLIENINNYNYLVPGMVSLTLLFVYKTYEFLSNKYCFIDAQIVIIYKSVLDKLLSSCNE